VEAKCARRSPAKPKPQAGGRKRAEKTRAFRKAVSGANVRSGVMPRAGFRSERRLRFRRAEDLHSREAGARDGDAAVESKEPTASSPGAEAVKVEAEGTTLTAAFSPRARRTIAAGEIRRLGSLTRPRLGGEPKGRSGSRACTPAAERAPFGMHTFSSRGSGGGQG